MSAQIVKAYGMRAKGGYGIRGFRAHCDQCGYLTKVYENFWGARRQAAFHVCAEQQDAA